MPSWYISFFYLHHLPRLNECNRQNGLIGYGYLSIGYELV